MILLQVLPTLAVGDRAPAAAFRRIDGATLSLSSLKGRIVVVEFTSLGCVTCRELTRRVEELSSRRKDVVFLTVSVDPPETMSRLLALRPKDATTILARDVDGALGRFGSETTPAMIVVGTDGLLASRLMRGGAGDLPRLEERIAWAQKRT